jgi:uncharacterized protein (TIGR03032 family)
MLFCVPNDKDSSDLFTEPQDPEIVVSGGFDIWLLQHKVSLVFTEKLRGKLYCAGVGDSQGAVSVTKVQVPGAGALYSDGQKLWFSTQHHLHGFVRVASNKGSKFAPIMTIATGARDIQDILLDSSGKPVYVSANNNCIATVDYGSPFIKTWQPSFIEKTQRHNCCHVSGMVHNGKDIRYTTIFSPTDTRSSWEYQFENSGEVIDIFDDTVICKGLTLPTSPTFYRNKIWLLNAGTSELGYIDEKIGKFSPVYKCPGYPTSVAFFENYALIGLSTSISGVKPPDKDFKDEIQPSGLILYDLDRACIVHWIRLGFESSEIGSIAILPDTPMPISIPFSPKDCVVA